MTPRKARIFLVVLVLVVAVAAFVSAGTAVLDAQPAITPTLYVTAWDYLPAVMGEKQGPTPSPTSPPPTKAITPTFTASPTPTETPSQPTATATTAPGDDTPTPTATSQPGATPTATPDGQPIFAEYRGSTNQGKPVELTVSIEYERLTHFKIEATIVCNGQVYEEEMETFSGAGYPIENRYFELRLPFNTSPQDVYTGTFDATWTNVTGTWLMYARDDAGNAICSNSGTWSATRR